MKNWLVVAIASRLRVLEATAKAATRSAPTGRMRRPAERRFARCETPVLLVR